jgi:anti-anti-sigma regulatory factor
MSDFDSFEVIAHENGTEIRLSGIMASDQEIQHRFVEQLVGFVESAQPTNLVINFKNVGHCTTGAINGLLAIRKFLGANRSRIKLCEVCDQVRQTLNVLNLADSVCEIHSTLDDAISAS